MTALILLACALSGLCIARPIIATFRALGVLHDQRKSEPAPGASFRRR